jgi:hypothetical protein
MTGMKPDPTKPRWTARNERERRMMHDWVNARLNEENQAEAERRIGDADLDAPYRPPVIAPEHAEKYNKWRREGGLERAAAEHGVIKPARDKVRSVFPLPADLVQLPPLKRGKKYYPARSGHRLHIAGAAKDVERIRVLWKAHYNRRNRRPSDGLSAIEIAAARHDVTPHEIELHLKRFSRGKSPIS